MVLSFFGHGCRRRLPEGRKHPGVSAFRSIQLFGDTL
jgi:hypothetical protein